MTTTTATDPRPTPPTAHPRPEEVSRAIARRSFCTLGTVSPDGRPHVAGVIYAAVDNVLYVSTLGGSRKARNVMASPSVFVCIPVRRLPVGPPSSVQFQARAEVLALDDPEILALAADGRLKAITRHGELDLPGGCFLRITPARHVHTYGLGMTLRQLIRDPLNAGATVSLG